MIRPTRRLVAAGIVILAWAGCGPAGSGDEAAGEGAGAGEGAEAASPGSVWAVDLVRTLPGHQEEYLQSIEDNWAGARALAREEGAVLSYRALAAAPDSARGWDVILMTEYADSAAYADREEIFRAIFDSPDFTAVPTARPSAELREFDRSGVVLRPVVEVAR